jgi:hypothetical protein
MYKVFHSSVTGRPDEFVKNIAQNEAKYILPKFIRNLAVEKVVPNMWDTFEI